MLCVYIQLAYQMREARLAKAAVAELQRQLDEERRMQMEKRRGCSQRQQMMRVRLSDDVFGAITLLTDKVCVCHSLAHTSDLSSALPPPRVRPCIFTGQLTTFHR